MYILIIGLFVLSSMAITIYIGKCVEIRARENQVLMGLIIGYLLVLLKGFSDFTPPSSDSFFTTLVQFIPLSFAIPILFVIFGSVQFLQEKNKNGWKWKGVTDLWKKKTN